MRSLLATTAVAAGLIAPPARADAPSPAQPIRIIVAAESRIDNMSLDELRRIFTGDSLVLRPLNLPPGSEERVSLDRALLGRGPDDVARYWLDRKIRGQSGPPRVIPNARLVGKIVARIPGTIGYITGPAPPGTRAIRVGGLPPDHPRYPLQLGGRR